MSIQNNDDILNEILSLFISCWLILEFHTRESMHIDIDIILSILKNSNAQNESGYIVLDSCPFISV